MDAGRRGSSRVRQGRLVTVGPSFPRNPFSSPHSLKNRLARALWQLVWLTLFRPSPRVFHGWRRLLLRSFGAKLGTGVHVYPSAKVWAPWNLEMGHHSCLGPCVDCYNVDRVKLGEFSTVSQYSYLCTATHNYQDLSMPLITKPIELGARSWIAADVFVGPGVCIGEGAVVGARSAVFRDVEPWTVVGGNPARFLKRRELQSGKGVRLDASADPVARG